MTAIDFSAFVDELATISGETIRPFFRSALGIENKSRSGGFDPVTAADRAAEAAMRTLIALTRRGEPIYGMMHQPFTREHFSGDGRGARYRGPAGARTLAVRACASVEDAVLCTTSPLLMTPSDRQRFQQVERAVRLSRYGGDCYAYCVLAAGHVDLVIETELKPHDVLPLIPIIEGAGGIITTWENGRPHEGGRIVAAGDKRAHAQALELLKG